MLPFLHILLKYSAFVVFVPVFFDNIIVVNICNFNDIVHIVCFIKFLLSINVFLVNMHDVCVVVILQMMCYFV